MDYDRRALYPKAEQALSWVAAYDGGSCGAAATKHRHWNVKKKGVTLVQRCRPHLLYGAPWPLGVPSHALLPLPAELLP